ncbi:hypothetical protein CC2G_002773 [Coprinopsis cinerea AmutBmut pab1-1]|nr:hypothetical protein CC2G_002773 [Coprinopsis cinerea AmutBmut pab1-1]
MVSTETRHMTSTFTLLNVANNLIITALITFRLLRARSEFARSLPGRKLSAYAGVIAILIESALPLALFGLVNGVVFVSTPVPETLEAANRIMKVDAVFRALYENAVQLAPQMIIFRVTTGRSWMGVSPSSSTGEVFSQALGFNHGPAADTFMSTMPDSATSDGNFPHRSSSPELNEKPASREPGAQV